MLRPATKSSILLGLGLAGVTLLLSACTVSVNRTVTPGQVADIAADALEAQVGERPEMDCGDETIDLVDGTSVLCALTDPGTGSVYDAIVRLKHEAGASDFTVSVEVASAPR